MRRFASGFYIKSNPVWCMAYWLITLHSIFRTLMAAGVADHQVPPGYEILICVPRWKPGLSASPYPGNQTPRTLADDRAALQEGYGSSLSGQRRTDILRLKQARSGGHWSFATELTHPFRGLATNTPICPGVRS